MALQAEKQKSVKSRKACDDLRRLLGRQAVGRKHEIVILGLAPFSTRVIVIIIRAVTVGLYDYAFGFALTERMALAYFIHSVGKIRIEETHAECALFPQEPSRRTARRTPTVPVRQAIL